MKFKNIFSWKTIEKIKDKGKDTIEYISNNSKHALPNSKNNTNYASWNMSDTTKNLSNTMRQFNRNYIDPAIDKTIDTSEYLSKKGKATFEDIKDGKFNEKLNDTKHYIQYKGNQLYRDGRLNEKLIYTKNYISKKGSQLYEDVKSGEITDKAKKTWNSLDKKWKDEKKSIDENHRYKFSGATNELFKKFDFSRNRQREETWTHSWTNSQEKTYNYKTNGWRDWQFEYYSKMRGYLLGYIQKYLGTVTMSLQWQYLDKYPYQIFGAIVFAIGLNGFCKGLGIGMGTYVSEKAYNSMNSDQKDYVHHITHKNQVKTGTEITKKDIQKSEASENINIIQSTSNETKDVFTNGKEL